MAYDEQLATRVRRLLARRKDVREQKMFGGIAFMVKGHMACGPMNDTLIVRIGNEAAAKATKEMYVQPMNFTGRVMKSFAVVEAEGLKTDAQLKRWVLMAAKYAASQPPKTKSTKRKKKLHG
jgi:TfoX/Sxy family transcriptional regulator of competence genes